MGISRPASVSHHRQHSVNLFTVHNTVAAARVQMFVYQNHTYHKYSLCERERQCVCMWMCVHMCMQRVWRGGQLFYFTILPDQHPIQPAIFNIQLLRSFLHECAHSIPPTSFPLCQEEHTFNPQEPEDVYHHSYFE